jgi:hypothetical protein
MEKFACEMEKLLEEKLALYKELKKIVAQEKNHIVDMNVDSLWKMTDRKKQLASEIVQIREQILFVLEEKKILLEMDANTFSLSRIINCLPVCVKTKSEFIKIKIRIEIVKQALSGLASENKRYTNEYLSVIRGIVATITDAGNKEAYTRAGKVLTEGSRNKLLRVEV